MAQEALEGQGASEFYTVPTCSYTPPDRFVDHVCAFLQVSPRFLSVYFFMFPVDFLSGAQTIFTEIIVFSDLFGP